MLINIKKLNFKLLLPIFWIISYASPAYAYLDPGTGSMLLQGLIGGLAVAMSFISLYWQKVKSFFVKDEEENTTTDTNLEDKD